MNAKLPIKNNCPETKERTRYNIFQIRGVTYEVDSRYRLIQPVGIFLINKVGTGAYGTVVSVFDEISNSEVAIKMIRNIFSNLVDTKRLLREICLLKHLNHPNIVDLRDILSPPSFEQFSDLYTLILSRYYVSCLMETDLHRVIYSQQPLSNEHLKYFIYQALLGLYYLHSGDCIHRDLKPSNLLVNADCQLKICDFGMARGIDDDMNNALTEYVVTRWYRAPEIMVACRQYNKAIDIWSLGCIFAELIGRNPLFPGNNYMHQLQLIINMLGTPSEEDLGFVTSEKAKTFLKSMSFRNPTEFSTIYPNVRNIKHFTRQTPKL